MPGGRGDKPKRRVSTDAYVFLALTLVSFVTLFFSTRSFVLNFRELGLSAFSGARDGIHGAADFVRGAVLSFREVLDLRREYAELAERMTRYEQLERSAAEIRQENYRLREQLGFSQTLRYKHIPAEITGHDPDNLFSAFVINKGRKDGVAAGMPVIAYQDGIQALAGKVVETGLLESLVMPVYDLSAYEAARFARSRYEGIVEGQGGAGLPLLMRFVSRRSREEVGPGDIVVTSGAGGVFPGGITIGRVREVFSQEGATSMEVELDPALDFSRMEYVFVIAAESADAAAAAAADSNAEAAIEAASAGSAGGHSGGAESGNGAAPLSGGESDGGRGGVW